MRLLLVEDEQANIDSISGGIQSLSRQQNLPDIDITIAKSKESALQCINDQFFDFVVLDLKIPSQDGLTDEDEKNGEVVFDELKKVSSGTPVCFYSSYTTIPILQMALEEAHLVDTWGEGVPRRVIRYIRKQDLSELVNLIVDVNKAIFELEKIEISIGATPGNYLDGFERILKIFSRINGGDAIQVRMLGKGLSGSKVLEVKVTNQGATRCVAVAKLDEIKKIKKENKNYESEINRLNHYTTIPRKLQTITWGGINKGGIFYNIAMGQLTAFNYAMRLTNEADAKIFFDQLAATFSEWQVTTETQKSIATIRQRLISDVDFEKVRQKYPTVNWNEIDEASQIRVRWPCCHGDLHGENILVDTSDHRPTLIDYGDIGLGSNCLDPLTLELSFLFHPAMGRRELTNWPSKEQVKDWRNYDVYFNGCPASLFLAKCRNWAEASTAGDREFYATAYAYLIRQLKYANADSELILWFLDDVIVKLKAALLR